MKWFFTIVITVLCIVSCSTNNQSLILTSQERHDWKTLNDTIYFQSTKVGYINDVEWTYIEECKSVELTISLVQTNLYNNIVLLKMLMYVHTQYPEAKIKISFNREDEVQFLLKH